MADSRLTSPAAGPRISNERSTQVRAPVPRAANGNSPQAVRKLQHILACAARVFAEKGFEGASVRDISRASRVSLSGLYYYFQSKQQLLYLLQSATFTSILGRLGERLGNVQDPEARLREFVRNHLEYFLGHPLEMKVLSHEDEELEDPFRKNVAELKRRYYAIGRDILEELQRSGRARKLNPRVAMMSLFGMMNWIYTWHKPRLDPRAEVLAREMTEIFLSGISNGHPAAADVRVRPGN